MSEDIAIIGIGLHPFGRHEGVSAMEMGVIAVNRALDDAGIAWKDVQAAYGGSLAVMHPDTMVKHLGISGVPFTNIFNGCATGGNCLINAANAIKAGAADVAIAIGLDKHPPGAFSAGDSMAGLGLGEWYGETGLAVNPQFFAMKMKRYMHEHGITEDCLNRVAVKAFKNGSLNPDAWRRRELSYEEIANSVMVCNPLRKFHFCSPSEGAAAVIVCRADIAGRFTSDPIFLRAGVFKTRLHGSFEVMSPAQSSLRTNPSPSVQAAEAAYAAAGIGPEEIEIAQIQDTEVGHEIMHMAECGFCKDGEQEALIRDGATQIDGRLPINTDGGLLANGEPVGASGLRQIYEICLQLRGQAGARQVPRKIKTGLTHVYGFPGVSTVTILTN